MYKVTEETYAKLKKAFKEMTEEIEVQKHEI